jgi:YidC/Oxa1 family membrane protein insertase
MLSFSTIAIDTFEFPAALLAWLYALTSDYAVAIALIAAIVMALVTPLNLKSTKGMLEMQRMAPEIKRLQNEYKNDRQGFQEASMKLYQEHGVNPMASCLPIAAQMPVFIIMFRILHGMTYTPRGGQKVLAEAVLGAAGDQRDIGFLPRYLSHGSKLYQSLVRSNHMDALGLDLSKSPAEMLGSSFGRGLVYALLVVVLGALYLVQQRMVAARAAVSPTMSASQQKMMQYLPVVFAVFQIFFLLGLVVYYIVQSILRIMQQYYITRRFYHGDESLGRQAQAASERARELAKKDGDGGGGPLAQARRELAQAKNPSAGKESSGKSGKSAGKSGSKAAPPAPPKSTKRTTAPKNRPTPAAKRTTERPGGRPAGRSGSPKPRKRK